MATSVLIADDSEFMRNLLQDLLEEDHEIVGEAENGVEAVDLYHETNPDLVVMDVGMPIRNGIEATARIKDTHPRANIIVCTSADQEEMMKSAVKAGADGYISKPFQKASVVRTIRAVVPAEE